MEKEERNRALIRFDNIKEETITNQILLMVTNDFLFQLLFLNDRARNQEKIKKERKKSSSAIPLRNTMPGR